MCVYYTYLYLVNLRDYNEGGGKKSENAMAGNRTRIYCLEGNNANHYTTNAFWRRIAKPQFCPKLNND